MTLSERLDAISDIHTLYVCGELSIEEAWECVLAIIDEEESSITWH